MVAVIGEHAGWLRAGLGPRADEVAFVDMVELGRNPARIIPAWQAFLDAHSGSGKPVRGIGEPIWAGRRPAELLECQLHEALLNVAIDPELPFWLICPYDARRLGPAVLGEARRSHPAVVAAGEYAGSPDYRGRAHVDALFRSALPEPTGAARRLGYDRSTLDRVFAFVALGAHAAGLSADRAGTLASAVQRLAAGSLHRGAAGGEVRLYDTPDAAICEVRDDTLITDLLAGRRAPWPADSDDLWHVNQTCDLVQLRSGAAGSVVRVHAWK